MIPDPYNTNSAEIVDKKQLTADQFLFRIDYPLNFNPGQFIEVSLPGFGEGPVAPCSDPAIKNSFEIVVRTVGSLTKKIASLVPGDTIFFRGPYGNGWPIQKLKNKDLVIMAGGMGLIPMRSLIFKALEDKRYFGKVYLLTGARDPENLIFRDDYEKWSKELFYFKSIVDQAPKDYKGRTGVVTDLFKPLKINPKNSYGLICGPEVMCPYCVEEFVKKDVPENQVLLSLERRMKCGIGKCQHCNVGKYLVCHDGPVFSWEQVKEEIGK